MRILPARGFTMNLLKIMLVAAGLLIASLGIASPLGNTYTLHTSEEAALTSVAGTQKHVLIFFSDSHR